MKPRALYADQFVDMLAPEIIRAVPKFGKYSKMQQFTELMLAQEGADLAFKPVVQFAEDYSKGKSKIYKIADSFGMHLARIKFDIPIQKLVQSEKEDGSWFFEFPKDLLQFNSLGTNIWRRSVAINYVNGRKLPNNPFLPQDYARPSAVLVLSFPSYDLYGKLLDQYACCYIPLWDGKTLKEHLDVKHEAFTTVYKSIGREAIEYALKCLLYVESAEPDLKAEPGLKLLNGGKGRNPARPLPRSTFDVVNVGYGFHGKLQHVTEGSVEEHWKWQACGPNWSQHKLLFIESYERDYTKLKKRREQERQANIEAIKQGSTTPR